MRKVFFVISFVTVWIAITASALLWGFLFNWPDFVHVDYGTPLVWATNTLSTIAGPANIWEVKTTNLLIDLIFWLGIMDAAVALMVHFPDRRT
jgi:hypothetical protein